MPKQNIAQTLACFAVLLAFASCAFGQKPPLPGTTPVHLRKSEGHDFQKSLAALAAQAKVAFVAEGTPYKATIEEKYAPTTVGDAPLDTVVAQVAAAYDYDVLPVVDNVYRLRKRYTDARDLPDVTLPELLYTATETRRLLAKFSTNIESTSSYPRSIPLIVELLRTLNPAQTEALKNKTLRVSELNPIQQRLVRRTAMYLYVQSPLEGIELAVSWMENTDKAVFGRDEQNNLGYRKPRTPIEIQFNKPALFYDLRGGAYIENDKRPAPISEAAQKRGVTLGTAVADWNRRARTEGKLRLELDSAFATKHVTLAGESAATAEALFRATAEVYGLRLTTLDKGEMLKLSLPGSRMPEDMTGLPTALRSLLPAPLIRAMVGPLGEPSVPQLPGTKITQEEYNRLMAIRVKQEKRKDEAVETLFSEAMSRLRIFLTARSAANLKAGISYSELPPAEQNALAILVAKDFMDNLSAPVFREKIPASIARFDELYVTGGPYTDAFGKLKVSLFFALPQGSKGKLRTVTGLGGFDYKP